MAGGQTYVYGGDDGGIISPGKTSEMAYIQFFNKDLEDDVMLARAPMTNVVINDELDIQMSKTFNEDYVLTTFGHKPVTIVISGLDVFGIFKDRQYVEDENGMSSPAQTAADLFLRCNAHEYPDTRFEIVISSWEACVYDCVLVSMRLSNDVAAAPERGNGIGDYTLKFIGCRIRRR